MSAFLKNNANDLDLSSGNLVLVQDSDIKTIAAQKIQDVLNLFQGEWFLDTTQGFPWFQSVLGQKVPDIGIIHTLFVSKVKTVDHVSDVKDLVFDFDKANRKLTWDFVAVLTTGDTIPISSP